MGCTFKAPSVPVGLNSVMPVDQGTISLDRQLFSQLQSVNNNADLPMIAYDGFHKEL